MDKIEGARAFETEIMRFESCLARVAIQHEDIRPPNMLWSQENDGVMFIDLERATEIRRRALPELLANRKRQRGFGAAKKEVWIMGRR